MPRLLDLFCKAGGASMGYHRAGFEVTGVDIEAQPHYPFTFVQADALEYVAAHGHEYDAIAASPPCQGYSVTKSLHGNSHPMLIDATREALEYIGKPWVIENVMGAPLRSWVVLCGSMFGLQVWRHRRFESNVPMFSGQCRHDLVPFPLDVTGTGGPGGRHRKPASLAEARQALGIDWMNRAELSQAIPPAYTNHIGKHLIAVFHGEPCLTIA